LSRHASARVHNFIIRHPGSSDQVIAIPGSLTQRRGGAMTQRKKLRMEFDFFLSFFLCVIAPPRLCVKNDEVMKMASGNSAHGYHHLLRFD
jgi:hypothetical protein